MVDLVPFYPRALWAAADAPLSFLGDIRVYYLEVSCTAGGQPACQWTWFDCSLDRWAHWLLVPLPAHDGTQLTRCLPLIPQTYKDQFFAPPPAPIPSFFPLFAFLELTFHLPVAVWAVRKLWAAPGLDGRSELLLLVYGLETVLTTATCMWEAWLWDEELVSLSEKAVLLGGLYGAYLALGK